MIYKTKKTKNNLCRENFAKNNNSVEFIIEKKNRKKNKFNFKYKNLFKCYLHD